MASSSSTRPVTSKARGICRYYTEPRGCFAGNKCKFLHAAAQVDPESNDPPLLTYYDQSKRCRYYDAGFCKKGSACWFLHETKGKAVAAASDDDQEEDLCSICFEKPFNFGLLEGCGHIFCIECIKQWRDPQNRPGGLSGNIKKCPMCRAPSRFITPSSKYWKDGTEEKAKTINAYKESMARVPCRYFKKSLQKNKDRPKCLFGKDCFYQHLKADGTPYIFKDGVPASMRNYGRRESGPSFDDFHFLPFSPFSFGLSGTVPPTLPGFGPLSARNYNPFSPAGTESDSRRGGTDGLASATRRLQEVGQSLEMLNNAISGGASLDNLRVAIDALRTGLGRTDYRSTIGEEPSNNQGDNMDSDRAREEEDEVMERLEILADQMLASVELLRQGTEGREDGVETPPPPLEPIALTREAVLASLERRRPDDDNSSNDSMPYLQSVSNTSSGSNVDDDDDDDDDSDDGYRSLEANSSRVLGLAELYLEALQRPGDRTPVDSSRTGSRFSTVVDRDGGSLHMTEADSIDDMPELEPIDTPDAAEDERNGPPFRTDGRGRVVWSSPADENKATDGFTTDGRGRVVSVAEEGSSESVAESETEPQTGESSTTSGRSSLFGWLNVFF